jgi:hypothetical protein
MLPLSMGSAGSGPRICCLDGLVWGTATRGETGVAEGLTHRCTALGSLVSSPFFPCRGRAPLRYGDDMASSFLIPPEIGVSERPSRTAAVADEHVYLERPIHANALIPGAETCQRLLENSAESGTWPRAAGVAGGGGNRRKDGTMGIGLAPPPPPMHIHSLSQPAPKQSLNPSNHPSVRPHTSPPPFLPLHPLRISINDQLPHLLTLQPQPS